MKKCFVHLLMAVLTVLSSYGLFACRSFKKGKSLADSTIVRSASQQQAWQDETIEEIIFEADATPSVQSGPTLPSLLGLTPAAKGLLKPSRSAVENFRKGMASSPLKKKEATRVIFRKTTRQSSLQSSEQQEEKHVKEARLEKARETDATGLLSIVLIAVCVLVIIIFLFKSKYPD